MTEPPDTTLHLLFVFCFRQREEDEKGEENKTKYTRLLIARIRLNRKGHANGSGEVTRRPGP